MPHFKSTYCPYCKKTIQFLEPADNEDRGIALGNPYANCPHCGKTFRTGKENWSSWNLFGKFVIVFKRIIGIMITTIIISAIILLLIYLLHRYVSIESLSWILKYDPFKMIFITSLIISPVTFTLGIIRLKEDILEYR